LTAQLAAPAGIDGIDEGQQVVDAGLLFGAQTHRALRQVVFGVGARAGSGVGLLGDGAGHHGEGGLHCAAPVGTRRHRPGLPQKFQVIVEGPPDATFLRQAANGGQVQGARRRAIDLGEAGQNVPDPDIGILAGASGEFGHALNGGQGLLAPLVPEPWKQVSRTVDAGIFVGHVPRARLQFQEVLRGALGIGQRKDREGVFGHGPAVHIVSRHLVYGQVVQLHRPVGGERGVDRGGGGCEIVQKQDPVTHGLALRFRVDFGQQLLRRERLRARAGKGQQQAQSAAHIIGRAPAACPAC